MLNAKVQESTIQHKVCKNSPLKSISIVADSTYNETNLFFVKKHELFLKFRLPYLLVLMSQT